jgi:hypothetical protein
VKQTSTSMLGVHRLYQPGEILNSESSLVDNFFPLR